MKLNAKHLFKTLVDAVGPPETWVARCHEMANSLNKVAGLGLYLAYGAYLGPVKKASKLYREGAPLYRHGWLETYEREPTIVDPTRWVFENKKPYVYVGPNPLVLGTDLRFYDVGADWFRQTTEAYVKATFLDTDYSRICPLSIDDEEDREFVRVRCGCEPENLTILQVGRLANLSRKTLGRSARGIYKAIAAANLVGFVPVDNYDYVVTRGEEIERRAREGTTAR